MKSTGLVFAEKPSIGIEPTRLPDASRFGNHGTYANITDKQLPSGLWVRTFNGSSSIIDCGDLGVARAISFWLNPNSTTESILEEIDNTGVTIATGTVVYGSWDNCFVDAVDTDTITAAWHHIFLTSTTDVDVSAFRLGLVNITYFTGDMAPLLRLYRYAPSAGQIKKLYETQRHWFGV